MIDGRIVELRIDCRHHQVVEIYTSKEVKMSKEQYDCIIKDVVHYLITEGFLKNNPDHVAIYSRFGVIIRH